MLGGDERAMDSTGTVADIRFARFAWKTGTSSGFRDAWTIAYNPGLCHRRLAGKSRWQVIDGAGRQKGRRARWCGTSAAGSIRMATVRGLPNPRRSETREVCAASGQTPCPNCPRTIRDHAIKGVSRYETCEVHRFGREAVWPARVAEFLRSRGDADAMAGNSGLAITSPANGSAYLFVRDANPRGGQRIPLTATAGDPAATLHWFVNDEYLGASQSGGTLFWDLRAGTHRVVCSDTRGASRSVRISVKEPRGNMSFLPSHGQAALDPH